MQETWLSLEANNRSQAAQALLMLPKT